MGPGDLQQKQNDDMKNLLHNYALPLDQQFHPLI